MTKENQKIIQNLRPEDLLRLKQSTMGQSAEAQLSTLRRFLSDKGVWPINHEAMRALGELLLKIRIKK